MPEIILIAALDAHRLIGQAGHLPWRLPGDLKRFRQHTMGHPILMGRRSYEGIGRALPGRHNVVLSRDPQFQAPNVTCFSRLDQALEALAQAPKVWVIGGGEVYAQSLPYATQLSLTHVHGEWQGDCWFPALSRDWRVQQHTHHEADDANPVACEDFVLRRGPTPPGPPLPAPPPGWFAPP